MYKYLRRESEEKICGGCKFLATKPESVPPFWAEAVAAALELGELHNAGAVFYYPDSLAAWEWAALQGLTRGRQAAEAKHAERERKKQAAR